MAQMAFLAVVACALTLALTPAVRALSLAAGCVDHPDEWRKRHTGAIPRTGGVAIFCAYTASYAALFALPHGASVISAHLSTIFRLLPGVALVFLTGLADDRFSLKPSQKLMGEAAAGLWLWTAGVRIGLPGSPVWSLLATVAWLVLCANAFNLIDGVDGLATGLGLTATLTAVTAALLHGDVMLAFATAPLAGCLLGFLRYNFNPASIFLGDSGSLSIGFLLGTYAIIWSQKSATMLGIAAPAMALALPLLEVALSVLRRFLRNEPIFEGDRGHIHHRLLDRGFTPRRVALLLYAAGALAAALSLVHNAADGRFPGGALIVFAAAAAGGIRYLGYSEFRATRRFFSRWLRPVLRAQVTVEILERALRSATTIGECWLAIESAGRALGYSRVEASLAGERYSSGASPLPEAWQMRIHLDRGDFINVSQTVGAPAKGHLLAAFVEVAGRVVPEVLASFERRPAPRALPAAQVEEEAVA